MRMDEAVRMRRSVPSFISNIIDFWMPPVTRLNALFFKREYEENWAQNSKLLDDHESDVWAGPVFILQELKGRQMISKMRLKPLLFKKATKTFF